MSDDDRTTRDTAEAAVSEGLTAEQEVASGRPAWTPAVVLGSVVSFVGVIVAVGLVLAVVAYLLA